MTDLKTYEGWTREGRFVRKGEKAAAFLVSPDRRQGRAVFSIEQTDGQPDLSGWTEIVPRDEWLARNERDPRPIVKLDYADGVAGVWCGANKKAIETLKKAGYSFDRYTHRWRTPRTPEQFETTIHGFEARGYRVEVEGA